MRQYFPYMIAVALCFGIVFKLHSTGEPIYPALANIYDSTLATLKVFGATDHRIGFANAGEAGSAWIDYDTRTAVSFQYVYEDSIGAHDIPDSAVFSEMHRVMYPIYTTSAGRKKLCGAVTFDSVGGVHPITFEDSTVYPPVLRARLNVSKPQSITYVMAVMPFFHDNVIISHEAGGYYVLGTKALRFSLSEDYPKTVRGDQSDQALLRKTDFFSAVAHRKKHQLEKSNLKNK